MRLKHPCLTIRDNRVAETWYIDSIPSATEDNIAHEDSVFKSCPECTDSLWVLNISLDTSTHTRHCLQLSTLEFRDFDIARKHTLDKGCVLHDLIWLTNQLQLLHDLEL